MKTFLRLLSLLITLSALATSSLARAGTFEETVKRANKKQLEGILQTLDARIFVVENLVDLHNEAINGRSALNHLTEDIQNLLEEAESAHALSKSLLQDTKLSSQHCQRFYAVDSAINQKLIDKLHTATSLKDTHSPVLKGQILILLTNALTLESFYQSGADGGLSLLMSDLPIPCEDLSEVRAELSNARLKRVQSLTGAYQLLFGQDGLKDGFTLSTRIGKIAKEKLNQETKDMIKEFAVVTVVSIAVFEVGLVRGLDYLVKIGRISERAAKAVRISIFLGFAGYGAYTGVQIADSISKRNATKIDLGQWHRTIDFLGKYIEDESTEPELIYPLVAEIQKQHHKLQGEQLKKIYELYAKSIRSFGDKDSALRTYRQRRESVLKALKQ